MRRIQRLVNKKWIIVALILLIAGYCLMAIAKAEVARLTIAPILILTGFSATAVSLLKREPEC